MITAASLEPALSDLIRRSLEQLKFLEGDPPTGALLELPRNEAHGDLACSVAMQLASRQH